MAAAAITACGGKDTKTTAAAEVVTGADTAGETAEPGTEDAGAASDAEAPKDSLAADSGSQEAALLELWQDWTRREAGLRQEFMAMLRELDARRGNLFSHAVSDLGRNADTMFSPQCLLDSLFQCRTEAEQRFRQALDDASLHLRLSLNMAVALGR